MTDKEVIQGLKRLAHKFAFTGHYGNEELLLDAVKKIEELGKLRGCECNGKGRTGEEA